MTEQCFKPFIYWHCQRDSRFQNVSQKNAKFIIIVIFGFGKFESVASLVLNDIYTYLASPAIFDNSYAYWDKPRLLVSQSGYLTAQENYKRRKNEEKNWIRRKFALWVYSG